MYENHIIDDITDVMLDLHDVQHMQEFGFDVFKMFQAFEHRHKENNGSLKPYIIENDYFERYNKRQVEIIQCINEVIESRVGFERTAKKEYYDYLDFHEHLEYLGGMK